LEWFCTFFVEIDSANREVTFLGKKMVLVSYFSDLKQIVYEFFSLNLNIFFIFLKNHLGPNLPNPWLDDLLCPVFIVEG